MKARPDSYIAQPTLALSTCPTLVEAGIAPRHLDLRPFVLVGDQVRLTPGGLTRVALRKARSSSTRARAAAPRTPGCCRTEALQQVISISERAASTRPAAMEMLGRTANDLFWMSRYIERAENMARLIEVGYRIALLPREGADASTTNGARPCAAPAAPRAISPSTRTLNTRDVVNYMLFDADNPSSVYSCLATARHNARAQRTALTREMWESLNSAWISFCDIKSDRIGPNELPRDPRLGQGPLGAVPRRAAQHDPAQRHLLLQPARHLPRARRQHRAHPRRQILRAAAAHRAGRRRDRQRAVGRHPALGLRASQLSLGLQGELQALAHRRLSDPQPRRCRARCAPATRRSRPRSAIWPSFTAPSSPAT